MKKLLTLLAAITAFTSTLKAIPPPASFVETNLTFALKMYINNEDEDFGDKFIVQNYATVSIKNADIIRAYGDVFGFDFDKSARLIKRDGFTEEGNLVQTRIIIRDKVEGDIDVTNTFSFFSLHDPIDKYKYSRSTKTGSKSTIERKGITFLADDEDPDTTNEEMNLSGIDRVTYKRILINKLLLADLETRSGKVTGDAVFYVIIKSVDGYLEGVVEGTYKVSGAKVVVLN